MTLEYETVTGGLVHRRHAGSLALELRAENIRSERTGIHARVAISCEGAVVAWSVLNVERDEDRVRLANSAYSHLQRSGGNGRAEDMPGYPKTYLKNDLDRFCAGLWDAQIAGMLPVQMEGAATPLPPEFTLCPYVLKGGGTILFAPPGRGKSYTLLLMAVSIDAGIQTLWPVGVPEKVLFINLERSAKSVAARLGNVNAVLGLPRIRAISTINARGRSLSDVAAAAERYIKDNGIGVVFVDSISRAGAGDLKDDVPVNRIADQLNRMCETWLGLAHTPRADESHLYGSVMFEAAADVVVQLLSEQDEEGPLGIGLQITKQNDMGNRPLWIGALEFNDTGLSSVRRARPGEFLEIEGNKKMTMKEAVRQHLMDVGAQSAGEIADELGFNRSNVASLLSKDERTFQQAGKVGKKVLYVVRPPLPVALPVALAARGGVPASPARRVVGGATAVEEATDELPF